jgi:glycosyltransferase involved in cell wall biosynthesis
MKIAIYDIIHLEQVMPLIRVCQQLKLRTILFTNERFRYEIEKQLATEGEPVSVSYIASGVKEWQFMRVAGKKLRTENVDFFILNSNDGKHLLWYKLLKGVTACKFVLNVHEVHNLFYTKYEFGIRSILRHFGKKLLVQKADAFIVNTEAMKFYMEEKAVTTLPVFWIPAVVYENHREKTIPHSGFTIAIPGTIDHRRRDYRFVLDVYEKLISSCKSVPRLILAGAPYGQYGDEILTGAAALNSKGGDIHFSRTDLPEADFETILYGSDILWSPLKISTSIFDGIPEVYGQTKNSGNTHDAVRFARPMLIPCQLITSKEIESSVVRYEDEESCADIIAKIASDPNMQKHLKSEAVQNSMAFTTEKVAAKFQLLVDAMVK